MKFEIGRCPLCNKSLNFRSVAGVHVYECPTKLNGVPNNFQSHYIIEKDIKFEIQHMIVLPYSIDTYADSAKSRIYKLIDDRWRLIHEVSIIHPEAEDKLLARIQTLLTFS